jgi:hypothetical protein
VLAVAGLLILLVSARAHRRDARVD